MYQSSKTAMLAYVMIYLSSLRGLDIPQEIKARL